jgi:hypothetical protein
MLVSEIDEHRKYLTDKGRISAFGKAIAEIVRPGAIVVDLGSGTGIFGLLACRAGASRVYSIEETGMSEVARAICRSNGFDDRVRFLNAHSRDVELPERADVVVSDQIGFFGFDAGVLRFFSDARERFLKPGGTLIPRRIDLCVAGVERPDMSARVAFWQRSTAGFDFSAVRPWAVNTTYVPVFASDQLLTAPAIGISIDLSAPIPAVLVFDVCVEISRPGTLDGIGGWFAAQLSPTVMLSNAVGSEHFVDRWNVFFPIDRPVDVATGDHVRIAMHILHDQLLVNWTVEVFDPPDGPGGSRPARIRFDHSTFRGLLISREELQRTKAESVPALTPAGAARRSVFALCDGHRPIKEIVDDVHRQHPMLFRTTDEASAFVAKVLAENIR